MTAVLERFALGDRVVIGENTTKAPVGKVGRVTNITENGTLIVDVGLDQKHVVAASSCTRHEGPPPGRELVPLARASTPDVAPAPAAVRVVEQPAPAPSPPPVAAPRWRLGDRVCITREQEDGTVAGTIGAVFGSSAVQGYYQVKTPYGMVVVAGEDLETAPAPEPAAPTPVAKPTHGSTGQKRGPYSEERKQAMRDGRARKKAEREAQAALADVVVEILPERDGEPVERAPALRLAEPPERHEPATLTRQRFTPPEQPRPAVGVHDALRWAIAAGAEQHLSTTALRSMIDALDVVEREVLR